MFADLSWSHLLILGGIAVLVFGARRFPEIGRSLGQGINNLYRGMSGKLDNDPPALPPDRSSSDRLRD